MLQASYEVYFRIAKEKKSTIGETLGKPCPLKAAEIILGNDSKQKLSQIPPSFRQLC